MLLERVREVPLRHAGAFPRFAYRPSEGHAATLDAPFRKRKPANSLASLTPRTRGATFTLMKPPEYLTTGEVAIRLGVSSRRVIQLADEGRLAHKRVGKGMRLFDPDAVAVFIAGREPEHAA